MAYKRTPIDSPNFFQTIYWSNGGGRDSYINYDNGGFNSLYEPSKSPDRGTTYLGSKKPSGLNLQMSSSPSSIKRVSYHHNGTGRDTYIA